ncbi:MAG: glycosyltransferase [Nanoarchaeota archaeon]|nr:glycosyltransferase [Nanoarchaeota archaeon]
MLSIIIPLFNGSKTIAKTLHSIIDNNHSDFEIIIVNDASTDNFENEISPILTKFQKIKIINLKENHGAAFARNVGIDNAKGEIIVFIDSDIIIPKNTLQNFSRSNSDITMGIYSRKRCFSNLSSKYKSEFLYYVHLNEKVSFWTGCAAVKKHVFEKLKFDESIKGANVEDTDFGFRCAEQGFSSKTDKSIQVMHNHKHNFLSLMKNDFSKAKGLAGLRKEHFLKTYIDFKLYWFLKKYIFMLFLTYITAGTGFIFGKLNNPYLKQLKNFFFKKSPVQLTLFVTNRCNASCAHCLNKQKNPVDISIEKIRQISFQMPNFVYLLISGGEPFLREDLADVVNAFSVNNEVLNTVIVTNGYSPNRILRQTKEILLKYRRHLVINVSIDGLNKYHDKIKRINGSFDNAIKTIKLLKTLKYSNLNIGVIMTMTKNNQENLSKTFDFIKNLGVDSIALNLVRGEPELLPDMKYYSELAERVNNNNKNYTGFFLSKLNRIVKKKMRELIIQIVKKGYQIPCYAGRLNVVIDNQANVYPCEMLSKSMGDLNKLSFQDIWKSKNAKETRRFIKKTKCSCTEECNLNINILFNVKYYPLMLLKNLFKKNEV